MPLYYTLRWLDQSGGALSLIDQRCIPFEVSYLTYTDAAGVATAIRQMVVRGAPAIGAVAAYGMALAAAHSQAVAVPALQSELRQAAEMLRQARPTAVNLFWAIERILARLSDPVVNDVGSIRQAVLAEAHAIAVEDVKTNQRMGIHGLEVIPTKRSGQSVGIIHHCNTGALATVDYGTALGVIRTAHEQGHSLHVWVDETRPRLQGARLTAWELQQLGIPHTVIVDGASGFFMRQDKVDLCLVGCDRVAANGDTANKIGTYNLALAAYAHGIPFYIVGPTSTVDLSIPNGDQIPIEDRPADEVNEIAGTPVMPSNVPVANPAFDVTPARYITGIITESGIARPPYLDSLKRLTGRQVS